LDKRNPSVNWNARIHPFARRVLTFFENISLRFEQPLNWLINDPRFNPLYHTGTITIFLLFVILFTGLYLTMFYPFGFTLSYRAVTNIEANLVGRIIRALHRYASDAAVIFALLHGWRTFFQDRFRGPRWLAWVTGVGMAVLVWGVGVTGYWLIWDSRAQILNQTLFDLISGTRTGSAFLVNFVVGHAADSGWEFMLILLVIHLGVSAIVGLFLWWHLQRMSRAKWFPPKYWMAISFAVLLLAAIVFPIGMLPPANPTQLPGQTTVDLFYLSYLPVILKNKTLFWALSLTITALAAVLPWLMPRDKKIQPVKVDLNHCDGCTLCERDCPYLAIKMIPRTDGARPKFQAEIDSNLCVSCGVCIGSCPDNALSFGEPPLEPLWRDTLAAVAENKNKKVIFTCERHALMNASALDENALIVPLTCIAMANPNLAAQVLEAGASEVQFIGCPPEDCANREGNLWMQERLSGARLPKLKPAFMPLVKTNWVAPTQFKRDANQTEATAYHFAPSKKHLRSILPLLALMFAAVAAQIYFSDFPANFFAADESLVTINLAHRSGYPLVDVAQSIPPEPALDQPTRLTLIVDGETILDQTYLMEGEGLTRVALIFEQARVSASKHHIQLVMYDRADKSIAQTIFDKTIALEPRQNLNLSFKDQHLEADPIAGESLYYESSGSTNAGCRICHSLVKDEVIVGPSFYGVATRAATRIPGLSAEEYLRQSILEPNAYVVPGFPKGQMVQNLGEILSADQIDDLIAFLMTMK
ncbi:MAG: cytochrome b N-terminal domain-containing protein, partial [Anaerolineales bacterium]|nr:cytochrome b N-terminal domain-containing protein [Anaerolineales bacterium]